MRKTVSFEVSNVLKFKESLLNWSRQFTEIAWLDSNFHKQKYSSFEAILAVDALTVLQTDAYGVFHDLKTYQSECADWIFGYIGYDAKNDVEPLTSSNADALDFPDLYFFQPKKLIQIVGSTVNFSYLKMVDDEIETDFNTIKKVSISKNETHHVSKPIKIKLGIFKDEYFQKVRQMLSHIYHGDIYEANFCQEFYAENTVIDPLNTYKKLNAISRPPFATYLQLNHLHLLSASPERYLKKIKDTVISQPIKGTTKRSRDTLQDQALISALETDDKERSENIMIVDLVRNDLSKSALRGSVSVQELCKVYTFEQVHQMISTVTSKVAPHKNPVELIKETFPMGSMTGAPKVSAMKIIEQLESFKRGLYSGAVGYFTPKGDFDFNVVIRSILYNKTKQYVSFSVGSAITARASPEKEYEECLLKAKAMREVLES